MHTSTSHPAVRGSRGERVDEVVLPVPAVAVDVWKGDAHLGEFSTQGQHLRAFLMAFNFAARLKTLRGLSCYVYT
jgi:hypothetical protein